MKSTTTTKATVQGDIAKLIEAAGAGQLDSKDGAIGGPNQTYTAYSPSGNPIVLAATGSVNQTNNAPEAATLVNFLDLNCQ